MLTLMVVSMCALAPRDYHEYARQTVDALHTEYWSEKDGWWMSSMWWQTANTVEAVANYALLVPSARPGIALTLEAVFNATSNDTVGRCDAGVDLTFSGYFDDEFVTGDRNQRATVLC
jgi:hypothetical protein